MHELAIADNILRTLQSFIAEHNTKKIDAVNIKIGVLQQVSHESLLFSLEAITRGTDLERTRFNLETVDAVIECNSCGKESTVRGFLLRCPACEKSDAEVRAGRELFIDSIEVPDDETEDREQKAEDRGQRTEDRKQKKQRTAEE